MTPTATKPIPPKTLAKLATAQEELMDMRKVTESSESFRKHVANFLTAARSVKDVLINEIAAGDMALRAKIKPLIEAQMNADDETTALVKTRNADIHQGDFTLDIVWIPETRIAASSGDPGRDDFWRRHRTRRIGWRSPHRSRVVGVPEVVEEIPRAFFHGITDRDAYAVCGQHLEKVKMAARDCVQLYG